MANVNNVSVQESLVKSFDETTESLKTTITNAEINLNVSAFTDSIKIGDASGQTATIADMGSGIKALDVNVRDLTIDKSNDSIATESVEQSTRVDEASSTVTYFGGYNNGALQPSSFILPQKSGAISSFTGNDLSLSPLAVLTPALPMSASSSFTLTVTNAQLDQVVQLIASGILSLTGSASLAAAISVDASSVLTLSSSASLGGIFPVNASSTLTLSGSAALTAKAFMLASAGGPEELSAEGLANAILDALLADHNQAGSVGEALNNVGASGNPWSSDLASNNTPGSFGEKIQKLLETNKYMGLK